jgi:hypothetical protein
MILSKNKSMEKIMRNDGIYGMLPAEQMPDAVKKLRAVYARTPNAPIYHHEGWYYSMEAWREQGLPRLK